ncbi:tetratricopeptide repeat protein 33 isoform X2 [Oenanthe melanoleuca]|uniref:tetratricopeptide repeat protein 33 isoform X2 n=1 Tax=Oenanthe melanoleuca TaxID=2939378 RepID=UPI0024C191A8|nr:tetratricopeptide repeat protein 33 isoform X2 [Oenanthe melanoleuca]
MASFGWKRKIGEKVSKATSQQFEAEAADDKDLGDDDDANWVLAAKRRKEVLLEDCVRKSKELKDEGANLAENRRYREALVKWDEALQLTPEDATLYEMKSQVLMSLHEMFPAVHAAEMAVQRNPRSWDAWQTLGRAQLGLGEIALAGQSQCSQTVLTGVVLQPPDPLCCLLWAGSSRSLFLLCRDPSSGCSAPGGSHRAEQRGRIPSLPCCPRGSGCSPGHVWLSGL